MGIELTPKDEAKNLIADMMIAFNRITHSRDQQLPVRYAKEAALVAAKKIRNAASPVRWGHYERVIQEITNFV